VSFSASILIPTRQRPEYLRRTLASVADQARDHGAEIVVVNDDAHDPEIEEIALQFGARYHQHGEAKGINPARNTATSLANSDLFCLLDDDVEVWPSWLEQILDGSERYPEHEIFGGPIRPRFIDSRFRTCGREPLPVTALDLGPTDTDAEFVWGANMIIRRRAIERLGEFNPDVVGHGDEEEIQLRLAAAGGRIRYLAEAGVDHLRIGADTRIWRLAKAGFIRGRNSRRFDSVKSATPSLIRELRVAVGCVWHGLRYRCPNSVVLTATALGRIRAAIGGETAPKIPALDGYQRYNQDFLSGHSGALSRRDKAVGVIRDFAADLILAPKRRRIHRDGRAGDRYRVLVLCVARESHRRWVDSAFNELRRSRHAVEIRRIDPAPGAGKFSNVNAALRGEDRAEFDWIIVADDDVVLPRHFLDDLLFTADRAGFKLVQPAHRHNSYAAWGVTRRRAGVIARQTNFVEIGPITVFHRDTFGILLPFPNLEMGWGLDCRWGAIAAEHGWPIGVVDATPLRHLFPIAESYPRLEAIAEAERFLAGKSYIKRSDAMKTVKTLTSV
jgi:GT2 family glycosyltransferase